MTVKDLIDVFDDTTEVRWEIRIYVDGIKDNILALANSYYDAEGTNNVGPFAFPYCIKDLFDQEVVSFYPSCHGISIKIHKFSGMKYKELVFYKDENKKDKAKEVIQTWK